jgi:predicted nucleotidyltransferase
MQPTAEQLEELVRRIVEAVQPLRIILYGSSARGEMTAESDLDVAVVVPEGVDRHQVAELLYPRMLGMGVAVDILVTTPELLERHRTSIGMVYREIWREGRELYAA